jgi:hypothetical protein
MVALGHNRKTACIFLLHKQLRHNQFQLGKKHCCKQFYFFHEHAGGLRIISLLEETNKVQTHPDFERKTTCLLHEKATQYIDC